MFRISWLIGCAVLITSLILWPSSNLDGQTVTLKNGSQYVGRFGKRASLAESPLKMNPDKKEATLKLIAYIDDNLRITYFASSNVKAADENPPVVQERIKLDQPVAESGRKLHSLGPIIGLTPFDKYGRRTLSTTIERGRLDIIQGITEITPEYVIIRGLLVKNAIVCEMRVATSSLPRETLATVLSHYTDPKDLGERLRIVRLYTQAERYEDAREELKILLKEFPEEAELAKHVTTLNQLSANRLVREIENRRSAGQHQLAISMLDGFPSEGVAGETLIQVRDMLGEYQKFLEQRERVIQQIDELAAKISDPELRARVQPICQEIKQEISIHNWDRFADLLRLSDDEQLTSDQKLSIAIGGWILGAGNGGENLAVAASTVELRDKVRDYLRTERKGERDEIKESSQSLEGYTPDVVAKILANMKPPIETSPEVVDNIPGLLQLTVNGIDEQPEFKYFIQLPPEYDPYRRYPCVVTLNGGTTELQQVDWWAGSHDTKLGIRLGQAGRQGYIVIAPVWTRPYQKQYEYTFREHAAVLFSLRDACQRFSINTDRVFLSGHSIGGDAAWDIGLSHPDLWCGVLPITAGFDKYIAHYDENARKIPLYFVLGEMDGTRLEKNGSQFDRYLTRVGYDCTVVEYLGRGYEGFHDEIQRIFKWMETIPPRNFFPDKFKCDTMRRSDNFFWWLELDDFPPQNIVVPQLFGQNAKARPTKTSATIVNKSRVSIDTGAGKVTVWLSPELVRFEDKVTVVVDGKNAGERVVPSVDVILEDARTRGDRLHPFWAKVTANASGRRK